MAEIYRHRPILGISTMSLSLFTSTQQALEECSFKAIKIGTNQKPVCNFLLVFHCNFVYIFYRFRDITIYWSKICIFLPLLPTPVSFDALTWGVLL